MNVTVLQLIVFLLIFVRITSVFLSAPVFNFRGIPKIYKLGLSGLLALILTPVVQPTVGEITIGIIPVTILIFKEILTGISIAIVLTFLFAGVQLAGEYVGVDMGFYIAQEIDPSLNQQVSVITNLNNLIAMLIFLIIDGHLFLIEALAQSYRILPIGDWQISSLAIQKIMRLSAEVFVIGVKISAPAFVTLFLTSVAMSIVARAVPQMNIFFVGFPLRIAMGLFALSLGLPLFVFVFKKLLGQFETDIIYLLKVM